MKKILSFEEIMQILTQVAENQAKSEAKFEKELAEYKKQQAESDEKYEAKREKEKAEYEAKREKERAEDRKALEEYKKQQAEADEKYKKERAEADEKYKKERAEADARYEKRSSESDKKLKEITTLFGKLGILQGDIAEDLFYRNIDNLFLDRNKHFNSVIRKLKKKDDNNVTKGEFDIVAVNDTEVLVVEVKNKLTYQMVNDFIEKRLPQFKEFFPQYANYKIIGGMGALVIYSEVEKYAEKQGLYVITQTSDGGASIANKPEFKEKVFA